MADRVTGEVQFQAQGRTWTIVFNINSICRAEDRLDKGIGEIAAAIMRGGRLGYIRAVLWAALADQAPQMTEEQVGAVIDEIGLARSGELVVEAFRVAFPEVFAAEADGQGDPPPAPAAARRRAGAAGGTGSDTTKSGAA